jgi:threonine dehydrogenase-like Zn-dependent dehydrogenase
MALVRQGFKTFVYSRSKKPNPKADLVESFGVEYISSDTHSIEDLAARVGPIDLVYEALGVSRISFQVMKMLALNGVFVFTGIPAPKPPIEIEADILMRNVVLKNQVVVGTVNADNAAFQNAISDLGIFMDRWPAALKALITGRYTMDRYKELLLGDRNGIKNVIAIA